jgi:uncharacterized protein (DUF433 family)
MIFPFSCSINLQTWSFSFSLSISFSPCFGFRNGPAENSLEKISSQGKKLKKKFDFSDNRGIWTIGCRLKGAERMVEIDWKKYIHSDPEILVGKPVVGGTRLSVEIILGLFAAGWNEQQVLENYPSLIKRSLRVVFAFSTDCMREESL